MSRNTGLNRKPYNLDYINVAWPIWSNVTIKAIKDKCVKKGLSCHRVALFASAQAPNNIDHFLPLAFFPCTVEWILILLSVPQIHWYWCNVSHYTGKIRKCLIIHTKLQILKHDHLNFIILFLTKLSKIILCVNFLTNIAWFFLFACQRTWIPYSSLSALCSETHIFSDNSIPK